MIDKDRFTRLIENAAWFAGFQSVFYGADESQLRNFVERQCGPVPDVLLEWLRLCNGLMCAAGDLLGIGLGFKEPDIETVQNLFGGWAAKGWIPIASDGCGNYHVLCTQGEYGAGFPIVFVETHFNWDRPACFEASDLEYFLIEYLTEEAKPDGCPFVDLQDIERDPALARFHGLPYYWD